MSIWTPHQQPFGPNHAPSIGGWASDGSNQWVPAAFDPETGALLVEATITAEIGEVIGTNAHCYTGQVTVDTTEVQVDVDSHALINGIIIKSLSTNSGNIYVGLAGVTTSDGDILEPGESRGYAVNNTDLLYIISDASTTDKISYEAN